MARTKISATPSSPSSALEWVGGRLLLPMYIADGDRSYRPHALLWFEPATDTIVGFTLETPDEPGLTLVDVLLEAMEEPKAGVPRQPGLVRIADRAQASQVRACLGDRMRLRVAATPELHAILQKLARDLAHDPAERSYFDDGASPESLEELFDSAREMHDMAPWKLLDEKPFRLDIPQREVRGARLIVIGGQGKSPGLLLFPAEAGLQAFLADPRRKRDRNKPLDLGTSMLSLIFEQASKLPKGMRRDAMEMGWPVDGPAAYPVVEHRDPDGVLRPISAYDISLVATVASVLAAFMHRHGDSLEQGLPVRGSEWYVGDYGEVWLTRPHDAEAGCDRERNGPTLALRMLQVPRARRR